MTLEVFLFSPSESTVRAKDLNTIQKGGGEDTGNFSRTEPRLEEDTNFPIHFIFYSIRRKIPSQNYLFTVSYF